MRLPAATAAVTLMVAAMAHAQTASLCDPQIPKGEGTYAYRMRGSDRCEGKFDQPNSVDKSMPTSLSVISYSCRTVAWKLEGSTKPSISWQGADSPVQIRVETLPEIDLRYRLDAKAGADKDQFDWAADAINALSIKPQELGVLLRGSPKLGGQPSPGTIILANLGTSAAKQPCMGPPMLSLRTTRRFATVEVCIQDYDAGSGELVGKEDCGSPYAGPYAPSSSIGIPLANLASRKGVFRLRISGQRVDGTNAESPLTVRVSSR